MTPLPPKSTALVGGEELEFIRAGHGIATVVLVNGAGGPVEGWHKVFGPVAGFARVFAYNRPGIGGSSRPAVPQTGSAMVASLRGLLHAAGLTPPYVLVGHSLGGLIVNLYARLYPAEVSAVVLLEATAPEDVAVMARHENAVQRLLKSLLHKVAPLDPNSEARHAEATVAELRAAPPFPPLPLTVLSGGKPALGWATPAEALAARIRHQQALARLSPMGQHRVAPRSGHFPQLTEPEVVVEAIQEAVSAAVVWEMHRPFAAFG